MSHDYELYCVDCRERCDRDINHGEAVYRRMWKVREHLAALVDNDADIDIGSMWGDEIPRFIGLHARHRVQIRSEYYIEGDRDREKSYPPIELTIAGRLAEEDFGDR